MGVPPCGGKGWDCVLMGVSSEEIQVQCGRGRRVQKVWGQEHSGVFSQQLQSNGWLAFPLGPKEKVAYSYNGSWNHRYSVKQSVAHCLELHLCSDSVIYVELLISYRKKQEVKLIPNNKWKYLVQNTLTLWGPRGWFWQQVLSCVLPAVLVPGFDLSVTELQGCCQLHAVLDTEVFLLLEAPLQSGQLLVAECRPGFAGFLKMERWVRGCAQSWTINHINQPSTHNLLIRFCFRL